MRSQKYILKCEVRLSGKTFDLSIVCLFVSGKNTECRSNEHQPCEEHLEATHVDPSDGEWEEHNEQGALKVDIAIGKRLKSELRI